MEQGCLPDLLRPGLKVVFCGTAAGRASAKSGCYYAHSNNKFWEVLAKTRLTDRELKPSEFMELTKFGIGLTDLCKNVSGNDSEIPPPTAEQREVLRQKLHAFKPAFL